MALGINILGSGLGRQGANLPLRDSGNLAPSQQGPVVHKPVQAAGDVRVASADHKTILHAGDGELGSGQGKVQSETSLGEGFSDFESPVSGNRDGSSPLSRSFPHQDAAAFSNLRNTHPHFQRLLDQASPNHTFRSDYVEVNGEKHILDVLQVEESIRIEHLEESLDYSMLVLEDELTAYFIATAQHGISQARIFIPQVAQIIEIGAPTDISIPKDAILPQSKYQIAIMAEGIEAFSFLSRNFQLTFVPMKEGASQQEIGGIYHRLAEQRISHVISLHVAPSLSSSYTQAQQIQSHHQSLAIRSVNTRSTPLGILAILTQVRQALVDEKSFDEIIGLIFHYVGRLHSYVLPWSERYWEAEFMESTNDSPAKMMHHETHSLKPIVRVDNSLDLYTGGRFAHEVFRQLIFKLDGLIRNDIPSPFERIFLEYSGCHAECTQLKAMLSSRYPQVQMSVFRSGSLMRDKFGGALIGVCVL